jgi:Na+/melibiose symporter-like transporter
MRRLIRLLADNRSYRLVLTANLISQTGDWILRTGLAYYVYVLTGSTLATATTVFISLLPQIAIGSFAGVFIDRWDRRRTMIITNILIALALLPLTTVNDRSDIWLVYTVTALISGLTPFFTTAEAAIIPSLLKEEDLIPANALNGQARDIARLAGAALGGVVAGVGGLLWLAVVDAASFLIAAALILATRRPAPASAAKAEKPRLVREWVDGTRIAFTNPTLRTIILFAVFTGLGEAIMAALMAPFVRDMLGGSAQAYGTILSAQAIGGLAGGMIASLFGHRFAPRLLLGIGAIIFGLLDLGLFLYPLVYPELWPAVVLMILIGLPGAFTLAGMITLFQTATEDSHRGRVFGAMNALEGLAMLVGTIAVGLLAERLGIVPVISAQGVVFCLAGLMALLVIPATKDTARPATAESEDLVGREA